MYAAVVSEERQLVVRELADPELVAGTVRLKVERCGICGSDLHLRSNTELVAPGGVLGHEIVGEVLETGDGVTAWRRGDRVASYHAVSCGTCPRCRAGAPHMCALALKLSLGLGHVQGGYAEQIVVRESLLHRIPDHLTYDEAALTEPLAIGLHGVDKAKVGPDDPVCILGAGPIGALVGWAFRVRGIHRIVFVDPNPFRRESMEAMGFRAIGLDHVEDAIVRELDGDPPLAVVECSGNPTSPGLAVTVASFRGRVVLQGRPGTPISLSQQLIVSKELEVRGAVNCTETEFAEALECLSLGAVDTAGLVTSVIPLTEAEDKFDQLLSKESRDVKVLLAPGQS